MLYSYTKQKETVNARWHDSADGHHAETDLLLRVQFGASVVSASIGNGEWQWPKAVEVVRTQ